MAEGTRTSRQRDRILEALRQTRSHPTAKWLYDRIRRQFPSLSLGTVYRNLAILQKQGLVVKLGLESGFQRYEAKILPHHHFVCERCGSVADLELTLDRSVIQKLRQTTGLRTTRYEIRLFGICERCAGKE